MIYRKFKVIENDGKVTACEPIESGRIPTWARNVSQDTHDWSSGPDMTKPCFNTPIPFVLPPSDPEEPFYRHNHCPAITWCPNGDLLAIWFSTKKESGLEMTILASRLRVGAEEWEPASEFFKADQRNMTGSSLLHNGKGTLYHINGLGLRDVKALEETGHVYAHQYRQWQDVDTGPSDLQWQRIHTAESTHCRHVDDKERDTHSALRRYVGYGRPDGDSHQS